MFEEDSVISFVRFVPTECFSVWLLSILASSSFALVVGIPCSVDCELEGVDEFTDTWLLLNDAPLVAIRFGVGCELDPVSVESVAIDGLRVESSFTDVV